MPAPLLGMLAGKLGGAGGAAGGAAELAAGASQASSEIGQLTGGIKAMVNPSESLTKGLNHVHKAFNLLPSKLLEVKKLITSTADTFVAAMAAPIDTVQHLGNSLARFVKFANPAVVKQFEIRIENAFANIGNVVTPILRALTRTAQTLGDVLAKLKPSLDPMGKALADIVDTATSKLVPIARELAPLFKLQAEYMTRLAAAFRAGTAHIEPMLKALGKFSIMRRLGLGGWDEKAKSDVAVRSVTTQTSAESVSQRAIEEAIRQGINSEAAKDPVVLALNPIQTLLDNIHKFLKEHVPTKKDVEEFINSLPGKLTGGAKDAAGGVIKSGIEGSPALMLGRFLASQMTR